MNYKKAVVLMFLLIVGLVVFIVWDEYQVIEAAKRRQEYLNEQIGYKLPSLIPPSGIENWKTYKNEKFEFEFKYPAELEVRDRSYVTPGGGVFPSLMVISPTQQKDEEFITIQSKAVVSTAPEISCSSVYVKCRDFESFIVYTKSTNTYLLNVFDNLTKTVKLK